MSRPVAFVAPPNLSLEDAMAMVEENLKVVIAVEATTKVAAEGNSGEATQSPAVLTSIVH